MKAKSAWWDFGVLGRTARRWESCAQIGEGTPGRFPCEKTFSEKSLAKAKLTNQGMLVDPRTKTFSFAALSSPSSSERNSFFNRFEASCSVELRFAVKLSNSSMKIIDGAWNLASSNNTRISFSDSPRHFEMSELAAMLKNVNVSWVSEHKAFASSVLPQPGTPCNRTAAKDAGNKISVNYGAPREIKHVNSATDLSTVQRRWTAAGISSEVSRSLGWPASRPFAQRLRPTSRINPSWRHP